MRARKNASDRMKTAKWPPPIAKSDVSPRVGRVTGSTVEEEDNRIVPILASDRDPLLDAPKLHIQSFVDSVRGINDIIPCIPATQELERPGELAEIRLG